MKFVLFYHSLLSDWNHGNAHFLRGVVSELQSRGHHVDVYEPANGWSLRQLLHDQGPQALSRFHAAYPQLSSHLYMLADLDLERALDRADVVIVHEWNEPELIRRVGEMASRLRCRALFHDTHHRGVTDHAAMQALDLRHYDGVLAFGRTLADCYLRNGWTQFAWTWHEAADTRQFRPQDAAQIEAGLVWIGNWGDEERSNELREFLIEPVAALHLHAKIFGVRYPPKALEILRAAHIGYGGWIANYRVPEVFARYKCTVHVPRAAYARALHGIPTIRMFEALACGIPLISAPWDDAEKLFRPGTDYLVARNGAEMHELLRAVLSEPELARSLALHGLETVLGRHTCSHRIDELMQIIAGLRQEDDQAGNQFARSRASGE